jgi:hypothetical protein
MVLHCRQHHLIVAHALDHNRRDKIPRAPTLYLKPNHFLFCCNPIPVLSALRHLMAACNPPKANVQFLRFLYICGRYWLPFDAKPMALWIRLRFTDKVSSQPTSSQELRSADSHISSP